MPKCCASSLGAAAVHREVLIRKATTQDSAERACGWSPDGRLLYLLLERDGFRDLYAQVRAFCTWTAHQPTTVCQRAH